MTSSQIPIRSISLPSRLHPINSTTFESKLQKLKSFDSKSLPISSEAIQFSLLNLAELYNSIQELTQSHIAKPLEELLLEGSIELIDSCNTIRELFQMIKENVQSLQSALRRKGTRDSTIQSDIATYFSFRQKTNSSISKNLKKLKNMENKINGSNCSMNSDDNLTRIAEFTISIFKCILMYLLCPTAKSGGWNLISRLVITKSSKYESVMGEVGSVDFELSAFQATLKISSAKVDGQMVQRRLQDLETCIEGLEEGLEKLFKELIRSRVALLNILTGH